MYASRTRFIPEVLLPNFERIAWPVAPARPSMAAQGPQMDIPVADATDVALTALRFPGEPHRAMLLTGVKHLQLGNAIVGAAEPPTELAVDILHHHRIRVDVGLVVRVEVSGRELVQHGWALRDDCG
jgi:hypothetical protein